MSDLFEKVGGDAAVDGLVEDLYDRVLRDPDLAPFFRDYSVDRIKAMQREIFAQALGAKLQYSGKSLAEAHHGKGITIRHFQAFMGHVLESLRAVSLADEDIDQVIRNLAVDADAITGSTTVDG